MADSPGAPGRHEPQAGQARQARQVEPRAPAGAGDDRPRRAVRVRGDGPESDPHWGRRFHYDDDDYEDSDGDYDGGEFSDGDSGRRTPADVPERISRDRLFKMPVPHAPSSGMEHGLVRRVVSKYYAPGSSPRTAFIHLSQERPRPKPKSRRQKQSLRQNQRGGTFAKAARVSRDPRRGTYKHKRKHNRPTWPNRQNKPSPGSKCLGCKSVFEIR